MTVSFSQTRTSGALNKFAFPPCRCAIDTWLIEPRNLAIKVIAAVLVLGVYRLVQGCARESSDLSQVGFRDRQTDACPSLDDGRGILAANSGKVIMHIEPGHLAFYAHMPSGNKALWIVQTR